MDPENKAGGEKKCRKFTNLVNVHQIRPVVSAALVEDYCTQNLRPIYDSGVIAAAPVTSHSTIMQYCLMGPLRRRLQTGLMGLVAATLLALVHSGAHAQQTDPPSPMGWIGETGTASYYGRAHQGRRTAAGGRFDQKELTAAHPWLPFGSKVRVTLQGTGHSVVVTITDRLYSARRVIDLSMAAARLLGMVRQGVGIVSLAPA